MSQSYESHGRRHPWLRAAAYTLTRPYVKFYANRCGYYEADHPRTRASIDDLRRKLARGETTYLVGVGAAGHNSGTALVEASNRGIRFLANNEEERYTQIKHCSLPPQQTLDVVRRQLTARGLQLKDVHAFVASWDYVNVVASSVSEIYAELPGSLASLNPKAWPSFNATHFWQGVNASRWLTKGLGSEQRIPLYGQRHHDSHAYFSYAVSPFARGTEPTLIAVFDGAGDDGSLTLYRAHGTTIERLYDNRSPFDSLALIYGYLSSALGGWTFHSSEGRFMGAAAWGNGDRMTNPYYFQLRQLAYFAPGGEILINRKWANWQKAGVFKPYTAQLAEIVGPPVPLDKMWNPDAILNVEDVRHSPVTQDRVDKAAALQMLYEDMLFHVLGFWIRKTGLSRLVLTGGGALNCVANMRLMEHFDETFFERYCSQSDVRLQMWVPPIPNDCGVPIGAAYQFAMRAGAPVGEPLQHAFYCGEAPTTTDIRDVLRSTPEIGHLALGSSAAPERRRLLADLLAYLISQDAVVGLYQGQAETGPRALGHRSILANPCNPRTRDNLNRLVKFRELVRPLAPMATYEGAQRFFQLSAGAAADDYNAYNYMILTAPATPAAYEVVPAVIHADGTGRVQIVRPETDPFCHAYLKAMGRRVGAEVSVNTSLNIGSPIVQTPAQAVECLKRSKGLTALWMIGDDGEVFLVWHQVKTPPKDGGERLRFLVDSWRSEHSVSFPTSADGQSTHSDPDALGAATS
jgi:carbamoyltransferase